MMRWLRYTRVEEEAGDNAGLATRDDPASAGSAGTQARL